MVAAAAAADDKEEVTDAVVVVAVLWMMTMVKATRKTTANAQHTGTEIGQPKGNAKMEQNPIIGSRILEDGGSKMRSWTKCGQKLRSGGSYQHEAKWN